MIRMMASLALLLASGAALAQGGLSSLPPTPDPAMLRSLPTSQATTIVALQALCLRYHAAAPADRRRVQDQGIAELPAAQAMTEGPAWVGRLLSQSVEGEHARLEVAIGQGITLRSTGGSPGDDAGPVRGSPVFAHFARLQPNEVTRLRARIVRSELSGGSCSFTANFGAP